MAIEQPRLQLLHFDVLLLPIPSSTKVLVFVSVTPRPTRSCVMMKVESKTSRGYFCHRSSCTQMGIHQKPTLCSTLSDPPHKLFPNGAVGSFVCCFIRQVIFLPGQQKAHLLGGSLALGAGLAAGLDALQDGLTVLVELELGDDDVGRVDAERDGLARDLLAGDTLDVNHVLETVHGGDLALLVLVAATDNGDLVVLADGDAADLCVGTPCQYLKLIYTLMCSQG